MFYFHKFRFIYLQRYEISTAFLALRSVKERVGSTDTDECDEHDALTYLTIIMLEFTCLVP